MQEPFVAVPNRWIQSADYAALSGDAVKLFIIVRSRSTYTGKPCQWRVSELMEHMGCSRPTVYRLVRELHGWLFKSGDNFTFHDTTKPPAGVSPQRQVGLKNQTDLSHHRDNVSQERDKSSHVGDKKSHHRDSLSQDRDDLSHHRDSDSPQTRIDSLVAGFLKKEEKNKKEEDGGRGVNTQPEGRRMNPSPQDKWIDPITRRTIIPTTPETTYEWLADTAPQLLDRIGKNPPDKPCPLCRGYEFYQTYLLITFAPKWACSRCEGTSLAKLTTHTVPSALDESEPPEMEADNETADDPIPTPENPTRGSTGWSTAPDFESVHPDEIGGHGLYAAVAADVAARRLN